jgi:hypothetical protein
METKLIQEIPCKQINCSSLFYSDEHKCYGCAKSKEEITNEVFEKRCYYKDIIIYIPTQLLKDELYRRNTL